MRLAVFGLVVVVAAATALLALSYRDALRLLSDADDASVRAAGALRRGEVDLARSELEVVARRSRAAAGRTGGAVGVMSVLPVVGDNLAVLREASTAAAEVAEAASSVIDAVTTQGLQGLLPSDGQIRLEALDDLKPPLQDALDVVLAAQGDLRAVEGGQLIESSRKGLRSALRRTQELANTLEVLLSLMDTFQTFMGSTEPRTYFVAAQNPAEQRGSGGLMGAYGIIEIDDGRLSIESFEPIQDLPSIPPSQVDPPADWFAERYNRFGGAGAWRSLNLTSDFPTAAEAIERLFEQVTGRTVDGTIAVDPFALKALMELTGPVSVPNLGPVEADGIVALLANEAFGRLPDPDERKALLGDVAAATLLQFLRGGFGEPEAALRTLTTTTLSRHVQLHSAHADEQEAFERAGIAGAIGEQRGDYASVVTNSASANKVDFYVLRTITYRAALRADFSADSLLRVDFANTAPEEGPPRYVIGPLVPYLEAGDLSQYVDLLCARTCELLTTFQSDDVDPPTAQMEADQPTHSTFGIVRAGEDSWVSSRRLTADAWRWEGETGVYELTIPVQPTAQPTVVRVEIEVPGNARITRTAPFIDSSLDRTAIYDLRSTGGVLRMTVEFERE